MSKRIMPFIGGCAFSYLMVLNHTYETEMVKKQLRTEIETLRRMKDFEIDQVAQFREDVGNQGSIKKECNVENMDTHYRYFALCANNSMREALFSFSTGPIVLRMKTALF